MLFVHLLPSRRLPPRTRWRRPAPPSWARCGRQPTRSSCQPWPPALTTGARAPAAAARRQPCRGRGRGRRGPARCSRRSSTPCPSRSAPARRLRAIIRRGAGKQTAMARPATARTATRAAAVAAAPGSWAAVPTAAAAARRRGGRRRRCPRCASQLWTARMAALRAPPAAASPACPFCHLSLCWEQLQPAANQSPKGQAAGSQRRWWRQPARAPSPQRSWRGCRPSAASWRRQSSRRRWSWRLLLDV